MKKRRYIAILFGFLALAWAGMLFFFSGQSGTDSSMLSRQLATLIVKWFPALGGPADFEPLLRKLAHFGIFAIEGLLMGIALISVLGYTGGIAVSFALCAVMAVANEYHQLFSIGRSYEFRDMLIDSGGALTGVAVASAVVCVTAAALKHRKKTGRLYGRTIKQQDR